MKTVNNTILITGGSAGIGLEIAKLFSQDNKVIITGRSKERLDAAVAQVPGVKGIVSDVSDAGDVEKLVATLRRDYPDLNVVINNAGKAYTYGLTEDGVYSFEKAGAEMMTNYLSVVRLNELLLPLLRKQKEAAIVNVSSIVAFVPGARLGTYAASKAAVHSYSQTLRLALAQSSVKVFELMPPLVATDFSAEIGGLENGIAPSVVAADLVQALTDDNYEIHVGQTADMYKFSLASPAQAFQAMNSNR